MDQQAGFETFVDGRVAIAYGRDPTDVAFATWFGPSRLTEMTAWADRADG